MIAPKQKFTREQIQFVTECIMAAALDQIASALPDVIPLKDYRERQVYIENYILGCKNTVGMALPVLFAQLTGEGMGQQDFPGWKEFDQATDKMVTRKVAGKDVGGCHFDPAPMAAQFVTSFDDFSIADSGYNDTSYFDESFQTPTEPLLTVYYKCPNCGAEWNETSDSACDVTCDCGTTNITALRWEPA